MVADAIITIAALPRYDIGEMIMIDMKNATLNYVLIRINGRFSSTESDTSNKIDQIKRDSFLANICSYALESWIQRMQQHIVV